MTPPSRERVALPCHIECRKTRVCPLVMCSAVRSCHIEHLEKVWACPPRICNAVVLCHIEPVRASISHKVGIITIAVGAEKRYTRVFQTLGMTPIRLSAWNWVIYNSRWSEKEILSPYGVGMTPPSRERVPLFHALGTHGAHGVPPQGGGTGKTLTSVLQTSRNSLRLVRVPRAHSYAPSLFLWIFFPNLHIIFMTRLWKV